MTLLDTRGWILAKAGFAVRCARSLADVRRLLSESVPEILVCVTRFPWKSASRWID